MVIRILEEERDSGMYFVVTDPAKCIQGSVRIDKELFDTWIISEDKSHLRTFPKRARVDDKNEKEQVPIEDEVSTIPIAFRVNLQVLIDCIGLLNSSVHDVTVNTGSNVIDFYYFREDENLKLCLKENTTIMQCNICTLSANATILVTKDEFGNDVEQYLDDENDFDFAEEFRKVERVNKVMIQSSRLRNVLSELIELPGATTITIVLKNELFRISAKGESGICDFNFPTNEQAQALQNYVCEMDMTFDYPVTSFQQAIKPLNDCETTYIMLNSQGILRLKHRLKQKEGQRTYIDFFLVSDANLGGENN